MSEGCGSCSSPLKRWVPVANYEVTGGNYRECLEQAQKFADMLGLGEALKVDLGPLRLAEVMHGDGGVVRVTWETDVIVRAEM